MQLRSSGGVKRDATTAGPADDSAPAPKIPLIRLE